METRQRRGPSLLAWLQKFGPPALNLRSRWRLSAIAVRRDGVDEGVDPDRRLAKGDVLVLMGHARDFQGFATDLARS